MGLFNKKQEQPKEKIVDYTNWEKDFGFLMLIISRKKGITKEFLINIYDKQKPETDYLTDSEIEPIISNIVNEINDQIGEEYKTFLIKKYFGSEENLLKFISEDVYVDLISDAINRNTKKITKTVQKKIVNSISNITKK